MKDIVGRIAKELNISASIVSTVLSLLNEGHTVPFIARYRKEHTQSLEDFQIQSILEKRDYYHKLLDRKRRILEIIRDQDKLSPQLEKSIRECWIAEQLEDLYLPFKKKRQTRAQKARQAGLEPLAKIVMAQGREDVATFIPKYICEAYPREEDVIEGAKDIISEWINEHPLVRNRLRKLYARDAIIESRVIKSKVKDAAAYKNYFEHTEQLRKIPSHRLLAILRGESEKLLRCKVIIDKENAIEKIHRYSIKDPSHPSAEIIRESALEALNRLLMPSLETEARNTAKERADLEAIEVFGRNLKDLLLAPPLGSQSILAIDPGFRTGCKMVILNPEGGLEAHDVIFPHPPKENKEAAKNTLSHYIHKFHLKSIAIGNGTAGRETYLWLSEIFNNDIELYYVSEQGASIYSASEIARKEFPDQDITVRGAISIGRRLMDPLAELIKIDPKSIGVGQYQHDVNATLLKEKLNYVVEQCVNSVGVNLNTASSELLQHIAGLGKSLADNIVDHRTAHGPFVRRQSLLDVSRLGPKAYEQAVGFLRIKGEAEPLDNTGIHPERYELVHRIAADQRCAVVDLLGNYEKLNRVKWGNYISDKIGRPTLEDIKKELAKPGLDPRGHAKPMHFDSRIQTIEDLKLGMIVQARVSNITKFGAFVDIGIKENGLIHISQMSHRRIKDPLEVLQLDQQLRVKVIDIDLARKRVGLSIKEL